MIFNQTKENKVASVLSGLYGESFVPTGTSVSLNLLCQLYEIDRIRTFARVPNTDIFVNIDDDSYGELPKFKAEENGFDFNRSLYQKSNETKKSIMPYLVEHPFIHTFDMKQYEEGLAEIAYVPTDGKVVQEALIYTMISRATGIMGYLVLEQFEGSRKFSDEEFIEVDNICKTILLRIENDETAKQLRKEEEKSEFDDLTGLPVFAKFKEDANNLLKECNDYYLVYLDIDKFKYINENYNFTTGNQILIETANVLANFSYKDGICCRVTDDKFCMLLKYAQEDILWKQIDKINRLLIEMQNKFFSDIKITYIFGVYVLHKENSITLAIDKANVARNKKKGAFHNTFEIYDKSLEEINEQEKQLEMTTKVALANKEFIPFLQPKFTLNTREICGAEALARWKTEDRLIPPSEFIPVFEKNGFIVRLDFEIIEQTFQFIRESLDKGYELFPISINISRGHLKNDNFLDVFMGKVDQYNIPTNLIEIEITESLFAEDKGTLFYFITQIRKKGIRVSVDDFGSAYSSLSLLKDIEVDTIKLDKGFIDNIRKYKQDELVEKDKIIIHNIINMISDLGFTTLFEGIETEEQLALLKEVECDLGQGYLYSMPLSLEEFEKNFLANK